MRKEPIIIQTTVPWGERNTSKGTNSRENSNLLRIKTKSQQIEGKKQTSPKVDMRIIVTSNYKIDRGEKKLTRMNWRINPKKILEWIKEKYKSLSSKE